MDKNALLIELSESDHTDFGRVNFAEQREEQKVFSAIWALESQVNNGGFVQYLISHDGDTADFAPRALKTIGASSCAGIVERAWKVVSNQPIPTSRESREQLAESLTDEAQAHLEDLDAEFFAYLDNLTELLFAYVQSHPAVFGPVSLPGTGANRLGGETPSHARRPRLRKQATTPSAIAPAVYVPGSGTPEKLSTRPMLSIPTSS